MDDVPDQFLVWGYTVAGSLLALLTLLTYFHIGAGTLRVWVVLVPLSVACAVTLWLRHESLVAVAWTLDAFLGAGALLMLGWPSRFSGGTVPLWGISQRIRSRASPRPDVDASGAATKARSEM